MTLHIGHLVAFFVIGFVAGYRLAVYLECL